jgi:hypothetical protein
MVQTELVESLLVIHPGIGSTKRCTRTALQRFQQVHQQLMDKN